MGGPPSYHPLRNLEVPQRYVDADLGDDDLAAEITDARMRAQQADGLAERVGITVGLADGNEYYLRRLRSNDPRTCGTPALAINCSMV